MALRKAFDYLVFIDEVRIHYQLSLWGHLCLSLGVAQIWHEMLFCTSLRKPALPGIRVESYLMLEFMMIYGVV